jgi:hypothetical protein
LEAAMSTPARDRHAPAVATISAAGAGCRRTQRQAFSTELTGRAAIGSPESHRR